MQYYASVTMSDKGNNNYNTFYYNCRIPTSNMYVMVSKSDSNTQLPNNKRSFNNSCMINCIFVIRTV